MKKALIIKVAGMAITGADEQAVLQHAFGRNWQVDIEDNLEMELRTPVNL